MLGLLIFYLIGQFKNKKQFSNVSFHRADFGPSCSWLFSATGHGKDEVDGVGGKLKSLARDHSIQQGVHNKILNAQAFHDFVKDKGYKYTPILVTKEEVKAAEKTHKIRWKESKTIKGTQEYHDFRVDPEDDSYLLVRKFSKSEDYKRVPIAKNK